MAPNIYIYTHNSLHSPFWLITITLEQAREETQGRVPVEHTHNVPGSGSQNHKRTWSYKLRILRSPHVTTVTVSHAKKQVPHFRWVCFLPAVSRQVYPSSLPSSQWACPFSASTIHHARHSWESQAWIAWETSSCWRLPEPRDVGQGGLQPGSGTRPGERSGLWSSWLEPKRPLSPLTSDTEQ